MTPNSFLNKITGFLGEPELTEEQVGKSRRNRLAEAREAYARGLGRQRVFSAGQQRRHRDRWVAATERKAAKTHRRRQFRNRQAIAVLRGQMQVIGVVPFADGAQAVRDDYRAEAAEGVTKRLVETYGSVEAAIERWQGLEAQQALRGWKVGA